MKEDMVMKRSIALAITAGWLLSGQPAWAQKDEAKEHAELAKALSAAKVSLQTGLSASATDLRRAERFGERSEEHTSELQSQSNLVCRLLLEKKKKKEQQRRL